MEYLFTDSNKYFDWEKASRSNVDSDICILDSSLKNLVRPLEHIEHSADIIHAGLFFYEKESFQSCSLGSLNWYFLNPVSEHRSVSWKASLHVMVIRKGLLPMLEVQESFKSKHVQAANLAFHTLIRGGTVYHDPTLLSSVPSSGNVINVSPKDERLFIVENFGARGLALISPLRWARRMFNSTSKKQFDPLPSRILLNESRRVVGNYTAIIPTVNRYDYLDKAINSLLNNKRPPSEIIVVDQTIPELRIAGYYDEFSEEIVKVFYLDIAGQCSARNNAIRESTNDWLLLFDDDSEAWPEMIQEHISLLENSMADVSTGISLAPWKDESYIGRTISTYHLSSVMDTGNCFLHKKLIEKVGMFDLAFDRGSGADDNLGKRIYLNGGVIIFNPKAIRTHHKASTGGLRLHGAWWKNKGTLFGPMPLPTESYNFLKFYPKKYYIRLCFFKLLTSYRRSGMSQNILNTLLFPLKLFKSYRKAQKLFRGV